MTTHLDDARLVVAQLLHLLTHVRDEGEMSDVPLDLATAQGLGHREALQQAALVLAEEG